MSKTTILVETETRNRLKELRIKGQSYDDLIRTLIEQFQYKRVTRGSPDSAQADDRSREQ